MAQAFSRVAIFGKPRADSVREPLLRIISQVQAAGLEVLLDAATREAASLTDFAGHSLAAIGKQATAPCSASRANWRRTRCR